MTIFNTLLSRTYTVRNSTSGEEALEITKSWAPDLVLLDIRMPGIDGYQTCRQLKEALTVKPPHVIMVSGKSGTEEVSKAFEVGADDYLVKPVDAVELRSRVELHFRLRESQATTALLQQQVDGHYQAMKNLAAERTEQILAIQDVAVFTLAKVAESRDNDTGQHLIRLREFAQRLAQELRCQSSYASEINNTFLADLYRSSPLHDIGKVGIPDKILLKPGPLTYEEFEVMKRHTAIGGNILHEAVMQLKNGSFLLMASMIAQSHHERWDGTGYPAELVGEEIPLAARIVSVVDVYDALTSARPYKEAWLPARVKETIDEGAGTQFDPTIVAAFDRCFEDILQIQREHSDRESVEAGSISFLEYDLLETA